MSGSSRSLSSSSSLALPSSAAASARRREALRGLRDALPVLIGFIPFALVLGAQATQKGLSVLTVPLMTGLNFGGGSEFTAMSLWTNPPQVLLIVAMSFLVNSRHILMGGVLAAYLRRVSRRRALGLLFFMCDESWALSLADARKRGVAHISLPYYLGAALGMYATWVSFTWLGAALGPVLGNLEDYGCDMAFAAVLLVLLKGMWPGLRAARPWMVSLVVAALVSRLVPGAWYVAAGAVSGLAAALVLGEDA